MEYLVAGAGSEGIKMNIKQPEEWYISIWKENGIWHEKYIEYVSDTEENRERLTNTINVINENGIIPGNAIKIEKDNMIGLEITMETSDFKRIADQLTGEFIYFSNFGDITIKKLFEFILTAGINLKKKDENHG